MHDRIMFAALSGSPRTHQRRTSMRPNGIDVTWTFWPGVGASIAMVGDIAIMTCSGLPGPEKLQ